MSVANQLGIGGGNLKGDEFLKDMCDGGGVKKIIPCVCVYVLKM
jgi:hypothetical protein